jgi:hypothetical protein
MCLRRTAPESLSNSLALRPVIVPDAASLHLRLDPAL